MYLDGILRILRYRESIDFHLLTALGKVSGLILTKGYSFIVSASLLVKGCEPLCSDLLWPRNLCSVQHLVLHSASFKYFEVLKIATSFSSFLAYQIKILWLYFSDFTFLALQGAAWFAVQWSALGRQDRCWIRWWSSQKTKLTIWCKEFFISNSPHWCHLCHLSKISWVFFPKNTWYLYIHRMCVVSILTVIVCLFSKPY